MNYQLRKHQINTISSGVTSPLSHLISCPGRTAAVRSRALWFSSSRRHNLSGSYFRVISYRNRRLYWFVIWIPDPGMICSFLPRMRQEQRRPISCLQLWQRTAQRLHPCCFLITDSSVLDHLSKLSWFWSLRSVLLLYFPSLDSLSFTCSFARSDWRIHTVINVSFSLSSSGFPSSTFPPFHLLSLSSLILMPLSLPLISLSRSSSQFSFPFVWSKKKYFRSTFCEHEFNEELLIQETNIYSLFYSRKSFPVVRAAAASGWCIHPSPAPLSIFWTHSNGSLTTKHGTKHTYIHEPFLNEKKDGRQANDTLSLNSFNKTPKGDPIYHEHQRVQVYYPSVYGTSDCINRTALVRTSNCDNVQGSPTPSLGDYGFAASRDPTTRVLRAKSSLNSHCHREHQHLYDVPHRFRKEFMATACNTVSVSSSFSVELPFN